jgi:hypothetical protein
MGGQSVPSSVSLGCSKLLAVIYLHHPGQGFQGARANGVLATAYVRVRCCSNHRIRPIRCPTDWKKAARTSRRRSVGCAADSTPTAKVPVNT